MRLTYLPMSTSGCGDTRLVSDSVSLLIEYEYRLNGKDLIVGVRFDHVVAYRFRSEMHSLGYSSDAYRSVCIIDPSAWKEELRALEPAGINDVDRTSHFALFLDSNGYFEVLGEKYSLINQREGLLGEQFEPLD